MITELFLYLKLADPTWEEQGRLGGASWRETMSAPGQEA